MEGDEIEDVEEREGFVVFEPPYGEREPRAYDVVAIAKYLAEVCGHLNEMEQRKLHDRAQTVFEAYCEQFRPAGED